ncbi:endonuclease/exonuclease/phosphatase family protein [Streptomyces ovatisporus]|uniref:Endonuclease/exonuclease/phosphatase family protein n=1 Tax=Streptomyces ovatisporus TaxID=1128682 RepID=A0ABV9A399_9ACTN
MTSARRIALLALPLAALGGGLLAGEGAASPTGNEERAAVAPVKFVTANVPFGLSAKKARAQVKHVMSARPDVMVLQEVRHRDVQALVDGLSPKGTWKVFQPDRAKGASAVAWNRKRFEPVGQGSRVAFRSKAYDRHLLWAALKDVRTERVYTAVGLHYPPNASKDPAMRDLYVTMNGNYRKLVGELRGKGRHPVVGGDWNHPLDVRREPWSPVPVNRRLGMTTNWLQGTPCSSGTSARGGRIDGFAFDKSWTVLRDQGCMKRLHSDHRPVHMSVVSKEK